MAYLHSSGDLDTGIADIDARHRRIVDDIKGEAADHLSTVRQSLSRQGEIHDQTGGWISNTQRRFFG